MPNNYEKAIEALKRNPFDPKILNIKNKIKSLPNISVNKVTREPQFTKDGKRPDIGCEFFYKSIYNTDVLKGIIKEVRYDHIISTNGVSYKFSEITIKDRSEMRHQFLDKIIKNNDDV